ncbi:MAG: sigma-70 family RNA polymerase sigma factor [Rhodothermales bacterium]
MPDVVVLDSPPPADEATRSFRTFVEAHQRFVYGLALHLTGQHHDADDLSQEVFIKAHRSYGDLRDQAVAQAWLRRIAITTYLNSRRKKAWQMLSFFGVFREVDQPRTTPADSYEHAAWWQSVQDALHHLTGRERAAFVLRHLHDLSTAETATAMDVADGTVKSLLYRAARKLRPHMQHLRNN